MAKTTLPNIRISGLVSVVPSIKKSIFDEVDQYGGNVKQLERIRDTIGMSDRYVVDEKTTTVDLCLHAAENLLQGLSCPKEEIDGLILVSQTTDYILPFSAAVLHEKLNLSTDCAAFDVNLGCSGYVYGLWLASMMISTGTCKKVLLLAGDTTSKLTNPKDRATNPLFGDAGTATLLEFSKNAPLTYFALNTDGKGAPHLMVPAGGFRYPKSPETTLEKEDKDGNIRTDENLYMNGGEVFNFAIQEEPEAIRQMLAQSSQSADQIDYIFFHQANKYIIKNIMRRLNMPLEKAPCDIVKTYGNQSSASIPVVISETLAPQMPLANSKKAILSGFGVGLSWATCLLDFNPNYLPPVLFYK